MSWFSRSASDTQVTHGQRLWLYALAALVLAFLALPTLIVIPMSFSGSQYLEFPPREWSLRWYRNYLGSTSWMQATATSFQAGALTTLVATPLGTLAAYGLFASRLRSARALHTLMLTPIIVPVILVAIGVFYVYVKIKLVNSLAGIVLAHSMLALPLVMLGGGRGAEELRHEPADGGLQPGRIACARLVERDAAADPTIAAISTLMIVVTTLRLLRAQRYGRDRPA